jgi:transcriptional regulator with XRE-family HTH domain
MTLQDVLDAACGNLSDNKTSKKLGISRVIFSRYRCGYAVPPNKVLDKIALISGLDPTLVYLAAYAEKITNPIVANDFRRLDKLFLFQKEVIHIQARQTHQQCG